MEFHRSALVEYSAEDMFDLIEGAEHYPDFLPWCESATILARDDSIVAARIGVAWHGLRFQITTRNPKKRPEWLAVRMEDGPFHRFDGEWHIRPLTPAACKVEFVLRYELGSALARTVARSVLERMSETFVEAFVRRANAVSASKANTQGERSSASPSEDGREREPR